jgi:hypothetical protein
MPALRLSPQRTHRLAWLLPLLLALAVTPVAAQSGVGDIEGTITDSSGGTLPGVTITAKSPALQVPEIAVVSEGNGSYRLRNLPAGVYELRFNLDGFRSVLRSDLRLTAGFVASINVEMTVGGIEETVTVVGDSPVVDVKTTASQTTFTQELLNTAPLTRTMWQVLGMTPGVRLGSLDIGGNTTGSQTSYTSYGQGGSGATMMDGFDTSHDGAGISAFYLDYAAFEEVQVKALGAGADVPNAGTTFQGIVKSGGNDFHGRYVFSGQSESMTGDNVDAALEAQGIRNGDKLKSYYDVSADLGGRIIRNKLWFYANYSRQSIEKVLLGYAQAPGPDGRFGTPDDEQGYPPSYNSNSIVKISYQPSVQTRIVGLYSGQYKLDEQEAATTFRPFESTHNYKFDPRIYKAEAQQTLSNNVLMTNHVAFMPYWANRRIQEGVDRPGNPSRFDIATQWFSGPSPTPYNYYKDNLELQGNLQLYQFLGSKHDLKLGYLKDWSYTGYNRYNHEAGNYQLRFDNGVPLQINTYNYPLIAKRESAMQSFAAYAQDTWSVTSRLTVNAGLRLEQFHNYVNESTKEQGTFGTAGTYPAMDLQTWWGLAPRVGAAYALTSDSKTVLKATYGLFNNNPAVGFSENYNKNTLQTTSYRWRDLNGNRDYDPGEVNLSLNGPDFISTSGAQSLILNPDLEQPSRHEGSVLLDRELAPSFSLRVGYVYKNSTRGSTNINPLRPYEVWDVALARQDPGPDGVTGNADDGPMVTVYDYNPAYRGAAFTSSMPVNRTGERKTDSYHSMELTATKRQTAGLPLNVVASFLTTKNHRWLSSYAQSPNDEFYPLDETWSWFGKVTTSYLAPYGIRTSVFYEVLSGTKGQRTYVFRNMPQSSTVNIRLEPYGERTLPNTHIVYTRVGKEFRLGGNVLELNADVHNLFNANTPTSASFASGPTFGALDASSQNNGGSAILLPRTLKVGMTFEF